jgi:hypothetical protein
MNIQENNLHVFDIDDTLFHTNAKVKVVDHQGKVVKKLSNSEFNDHKLSHGHSYDFSEFRSSDKFHDESKPIPKMLNKLKAIHNNIKKKPGSKSRVIMNTARADFDDKNKFLNTFRKQNVDIDDIHVHRAGNIQGHEIPAVKKVHIINKHLKSGNYKHVHMYDDSTTNLHHFLAMKKDHPNVEFHAHHVLPDGTTRKFISKPKLEEDAPANAAGGGAIAGIGVGPQGEPGVQPGTQKNILARMLRRKRLIEGEELIPGYEVKHNILDVDDAHHYTIHHKGKKVGEARLSHTKKHVVDIEIDKEHRRKGLATALYNHIEKHLGHKLSPSPTWQTPDGKSFWASRNTKKESVFEATFAGHEVFVVPTHYYHNCREGKNRYHSYEKYVGNNEIGETIRKYGRDRKNRKKPIIVQDEKTGAMMYLRYGGNYRKDRT